MKQIGTMNFSEYPNSRIVEGNYQNGQTAIVLWTEDGEPLATLSVCMVDETCEEDEFFVKTWAENERIANELRSHPLFEDTGRRVRTGFVTAEVWKMMRREI